MEGNNNQNVTTNQTQQVVEPTEPQKDVTNPQTNPEPTTTEPSYAELMQKITELTVDNKKLKKANDNLASENGGLRKQVNAKLTEEELKAQQKAEEQDELKQELAELRRENELNKATKRYMSMHMPEELATKLAQAELDGDMDLVTSSINTFIEAKNKETEERVKSEIYAQMPTPVSGNGDGQIDYNKQYNDKLAEGDLIGAINAQLSGAQQQAN